jgi:small subunit ribosomal protein S16
MAVRIRLKKLSDTAKKRYNFRIVAIEDSYPRDGRVIEELGYYDPAKKPAAVKFDKEKIASWVAKGAQLSPTVASIVKKAGKA